MSDAILIDLSELIVFRLYFFGTFEFQWLVICCHFDNGSLNVFLVNNFRIGEFLWCDFNGKLNFQVVTVQLIE